MINSDIPQISIICPIYNAEKYIQRMLVSLQRQTFEDFEVICILDASSDNSSQIVKEFASHDERFRVIENETNLHAGMSRNVGLDNAKGEFIGFVDADDECLPNMYEVLYSEAVSKNADYVISQPTLVKGEKTTSYQIPNTIDVSQIRSSLILRGGDDRYQVSDFSTTDCTERVCWTTAICDLSTQKDMHLRILCLIYQLACQQTKSYL